MHEARRPRCDEERSLWNGTSKRMATSLPNPGMRWNAPTMEWTPRLKRSTGRSGVAISLCEPLPPLPLAGEGRGEGGVQKKVDPFDCHAPQAETPVEQGPHR